MASCFLFHSSAPVSHIFETDFKTVTTKEYHIFKIWKEFF
ncbi:hypothetical protein GYO_2438 [Bacillus spizizenii TU-B-10]|uniref:Uncharacterized protein n=1 Tax=Bacillus spizizenii (strain DSM 15029 / JCM 12233 / NBRC 101239 / NRRL B-23049 / TU-B-10) TaxID=1052585 RepID=G4NSS8_BACS4|nr:hypothetical protein GYO_2438 [Bacillus spizizenii TU-B-10]